MHGHVPRRAFNAHVASPQTRPNRRCGVRALARAYIKSLWTPTIFSLCLFSLSEGDRLPINVSQLNGLIASFHLASGIVPLAQPFAHASGSGVSLGQCCGYLHPYQLHVSDRFSGPLSKFDILLTLFFDQVGSRPSQASFFSTCLKAMTPTIYPPTTQCSQV
jgi:hypothetical protein